MSKIKKVRFFLPLFLLLSISLSTFSASFVFTDESWIAAYQFKKNLTPKERFLPFVDIRERNYRNLTPGACIRTIQADFILLQQLPLFVSLLKANNKDLDFQTLVLTTFNSIATTEDYISKVFQLAMFTVFREEMLYSYSALTAAFPFEFCYRFYHLMISEYETLAITASPSYKLKKSKYSDKIQKLRDRYLDGVYETSIETLKNEVPDSVIATHRINGMMPIKAEDYFHCYNSPFVSAEILLMDQKMKNELSSKVSKAYGTDILILTIDKPYIDQVIEIIKPFDNEMLNIVKSAFKDKFGEVNTDTLTQTNLRDFLLLVQP